MNRKARYSGEAFDDCYNLIASALSQGRQADRCSIVLRAPHELISRNPGRIDGEKYLFLVLRTRCRKKFKMSLFEMVGSVQPFMDAGSGAKIVLLSEDLERSNSAAVRHPTFTNTVRKKHHNFENFEKTLESLQNF